MISREEVLHIAKLSRLAITEEEAVRYQKQLSAILDYVGQLTEVNIEGVQPVAQITGREHVTRQDVVRSSETSRETLLDAAPRRDGEYVATMGVFEEPK